MKKKKGQKGCMAIKVNLEKAYDRLDWHFLEDILLDISFLRNFTHLIMTFVTTCLMQVLWNGSLTKKFHPRRRVRQGNLLSLSFYCLYGKTCSRYFICCPQKRLETFKAKTKWATYIPFILCWQLGFICRSLIISRFCY